MAQPLRVLVVDIGDVWSMGACYARAFRALGHDARFFDEAPFFPSAASLAGRAANRLARGFCVGALNAALVAAAAAFRPHLLFVQKGSFVMRRTLERVARAGAVTAVFHNDDSRNPLTSSPEIREALTAWDLHFTPRRVTVGELLSDGAKRVEYLPFAYDEALHYPAAASASAAELQKQAVFVGSWAPERGELFRRVLEAGVPVSLYGGSWDRLAPGSPLVPCVKSSLVEGEALREKYTHAGAAVCLVRHANRDRHVMRTFEVPACEGFMLAERTDEHLALFEEGREAVYFGSAEELVEALRRWLPDAPGRAAIARAGRRRLLADGHRYEDRAARILQVMAEGVR